jgi:hypothetical protein
MNILLSLINIGLVGGMVAPQRIREETRTITKEIYESIMDGKVKAGTKTFKYISGVLSGWRWTALLDSMINKGELGIAKSIVRAVGEMDIVEEVVQGDDDLLEMRNKDLCTSIFNSYMLLNLEVNPAKCFVSEWREEYLRRVATKNGVSGYPARTINSLVCSNPVRELQEEGEARITSVVENWFIAIDRGFDEESVLKELEFELKGITKRDDIMDYVFANPEDGGLGFTSKFRKGNGSWETQNATKEQSTRVVIDENEGVKEVLARYEPLGLDKELVDSLGQKIKGNRRDKLITKMVIKPVHSRMVGNQSRTMTQITTERIITLKDTKRPSMLAVSGDWVSDELDIQAYKSYDDFKRIATNPGVRSTVIELKNRGWSWNAIREIKKMDVMTERGYLDRSQIGNMVKGYYNAGTNYIYRKFKGNKFYLFQK